MGIDGNKPNQKDLGFGTKEFSLSSKKLSFQVSSVSLASEDPVDEDSVRNYYLGIADYFFTGKPRYTWHNHCLRLLI